MNNFDYHLLDEKDRLPLIGLIVLQSDETIEQEFRHFFPPSSFDVFVSRVPSGLEVTSHTLEAMAHDMTASAALFPRSINFDVVAYGCTSGTSFIGSQRVAALIQEGCQARHISEPVSALRFACNKRNIKSLAIISPYIEDVSKQLRIALSDHGINTVAFGSFNEAEEAKVARIAPSSIIEAALHLARSSNADGVFLSCTNLKTIPILTEIEALIGRPVMSSNSVLAEHIQHLSTLDPNNIV